MENKNLAQKVYQASYLRGNFKLRSGKTSEEYFDKYKFESDPKLLAEIVEQLKHKIPPGTEVLAGLEMGGIPIATALSLATGLPAIFVRKKRKDYGTCKVAEGCDFKGRKVCIVEDVVTTGGQAILSAKDLRDEGAVLTDLLCVIQRDQEATLLLKEQGLNLFSLLTMEQLKASVA
jgi:orotate phosphoribosyltransferase